LCDDKLHSRGRNARGSPPPCSLCHQGEYILAWEIDVNNNVVLQNSFEREIGGVNGLIGGKYEWVASTMGVLGSLILGAILSWKPVAW